MGTDTQVTDTNQAGTEQEEAAKAAAAQADTASTEAGEQTEEQKQAAEAETARKAAETVNPDEEFKKLSPKAQEHINKKIKKLSGETKAEREARHKIEIENAKLETENRMLREQGRGNGAAKATEENFAQQFIQQNAKPNPADFETVAEHTEALADWKWKQNDFVKAKLAETKETETKQADTNTEQQRSQAAFQQSMVNQRAKGEEKYEDFEELVSAVEFHPALLSAIVASPIGEDIAYYIANNPAEKVRIEKLSPIQQAMEAGRIGLGLESGKLQIKKTTTAPPPPRTVAGNGSPKVDESKLSDPDWYKRKQHQKLNNSA